MVIDYICSRRVSGSRIGANRSPLGFTGMFWQLIRTEIQLLLQLTTELSERKLESGNSCKGAQQGLR